MKVVRRSMHKAIVEYERARGGGEVHNGFVHGTKEKGRKRGDTMAFITSSNALSSRRVSPKSAFQYL